MKFRQGDFFYNTMDTTKNVDLLATFPFQSENVVKWANQVSPDSNITSINDIFDPKISGIIMNPAYDFGNTFLPGNMTFNDNFNKLTFDLTNPPPASTNINESAKINGKLIVKSTNPNIKDTSLDISKGNINWTQDVTNSWQPEFSVNTELSQEEISFRDTDGGISYITKNTANPRCKYRKKCTLNHWHYSKGCTTQTIKHPNGTTSCKCVCKGVPVFSDEPHSHCDSYTLQTDGSATGPTGKQNVPKSLGLIQTIQGIKLNLTGSFPQAKYGSAGGNITMGYTNETTLLNNDAKIRELVCKYYAKVNENIQLQKSIHTNSNIDTTMSQSMMDATVQYKSEYLNVFNIVAGIFCASGYIYILSK